MLAMLRTDIHIERARPPAYPVASGSRADPLPAYSPPPPSYDSGDSGDSDLPAYDAHLTLEPWLALLRRPDWQTTDLSLFRPPFAHTPSARDKSPGFHAAPGCPWKAEYAEHVRHALESGLELDPCKEVQSDFLYDSISPDVQLYIHERISPELRNAACTLACRSIASEYLVLNPLFIDALRALAAQTSGTYPSPHTHWMLNSLCLANRALHALWRTQLPPEDVDALIEALFVLQCRGRFRRAARRRAAERDRSVVRKVLAVWRGGEGKWKKSGKASR